MIFGSGSVVDAYLTQGDLGPPLVKTIYGPDGRTPQDLTGATVTLEIQKADLSGAVFGGACSFVGAPTAAVAKYTWQAGDSAVPGLYRFKFKIVTGSVSFHWPSNRSLFLRIEPDLESEDVPVLPPAATAAFLVSLDGIDSGLQQLIALSTTSLASGSHAWVESVHDYFVLEKTGTSFTVDGANVVAGLGGGQWLRWGFTLPVTVDPSVSPGLGLPVGFRVRKQDGTAAWDKFGPGLTDWAVVANGTDQTARTAAAAAQSTANSATTAVALRPLTTDLASPASGKGASTIALQDAGNLIIATDLEGAGQEFAGNIALRPKITDIGGFDLFYRQRAAVLLGTPLLNTWFLQFANGSDDFAQVIAGGGGQSVAVGDGTDAVNTIGGIARCNTGTGTSGSSRILPHVSANFSPMCAYANPAIRFYRACRFRMITTPTADTFCWVGSEGFMAGVHGANSQAKFSLRICNVGANYITSAVAVDNAWHILESWHDGTKGWLCVDGEPPIGLADVGLFPFSSSGQSFWEVNIGKVGGAIDHQVDLNWGLWSVSPT